MLNSPFIYWRPLRAEELVGRSSLTRRLYQGILSKGNQAITGYPHVGKTSLCNYILDEQKRRQTLGDRFGKFIFSYVDAQLLLSTSIHQSQFWKEVLLPLQEWLETSARQEVQYTIDRIAAAYANAQHSQYDNFSLVQLFKLIGELGLCFVGVIDEFDALLHHPNLSSREFFASLRSLSSTTGGLSLVIVSRHRLSILNLLAQDYNTSGSPFFNTFREFYIGALPLEDAHILLKRGEPLLNQADQEFILTLAARQPFLTQVAALALHEAIEDELTDTTRYEIAGTNMLRSSEVHFQDMWRHLSPRTRKSVLVIALLEFRLYLGVLTPLPTWKHITAELHQQILELTPELSDLVNSGFIAEESQNHYRLTQEAFLWWLADELVKYAPSKVKLEQWLQINEMDGMFSNVEHEQFLAITLDTIRSMQGGSLPLIRAKALGFSKPSTSAPSLTTEPTTQISIFISHSTMDDAAANQIANDLSSAGFGVWMDHVDLKASTQWDEEIEKALDSCHVLLFLVTKNSLASIECRREWNYVLNRTRRVVPAILEDNLKIPYRLHLNHWVNFTSDYNHALDKLVNALKNLV